MGEVLLTSAPEIYTSLLHPVDNTFHFILNYKQRCCIQYINDQASTGFLLCNQTQHIQTNLIQSVTNRKQVIKSYILKPSVSSPAYSK